MRSIENVIDAEMLFGDYDAIAKIKGEKIHDIEKLREHGVKYIGSTL